MDRLEDSPWERDCKTEGEGSVIRGHIGTSVFLIYLSEAEQRLAKACDSLTMRI